MLWQRSAHLHGKQWRGHKKIVTIGYLRLLIVAYIYGKVVMYKNLVEMLEDSCRKCWWRKAILAEDRTIRYYKLRREVDKLASILADKFRIEPQDKIAVLLGNSSIYPIVYFAILKFGAVVVPLNIFFKGEELKYIINNSGAKLLITSNEFYPVIKDIRPQLPNLIDVVMADSQLLKKRTGAAPKREIPLDSTAVIIYTSGTTGYPKGAMLTHQNLLSNVESSVAVSHINHRDRLFLVLPMFHSFTMTVCMLMPLAVGAGIVIASSLHQLKKIIRRVLFLGVTIIVGIPSLYALLAKAHVPWWVRILLRIRLCVSGAAPLPETTLTEFEKKWRIPLLEGYGLSESSPVVSLNPVKGKRKPNSVGLPVPGVEVKIVGPDEAELSTNEVGEIIVKGRNVMKGYYNEPQATEDTIRGGWLFTGDMGKIDEEDYIYIVDRKKDMILVRGLNVYPREVEQVLEGYPGIAEVSVVGKIDQSKGEVPVAFIIPKDGAKLDTVEITKHCRQKLADYKVPRQVIVKDQLPRTPTGKILKRELRKLL